MTELTATRPLTFREELREQRWDDHRFYHQSRVNQSLHFVSALSFLAAYVTIFVDPVWAVLLGWLVAMVTRQSGHFFFEPKSYDHVNQATHEHKEAIKVGYNLQRKVWLHVAWGIAPLLLWLWPTAFGFTAPTDLYGYVRNVSVAWLWIAAGALLARVLWLCATRSVQTGLVWGTKILTDPFHDVLLYWRSPLALLRGERLDPMHHVARHGPSRAAPGV
jgi:hypothetical protein